MTADLGRLALVARRTSNAVVITDARRRITWVNEGFERITGYSGGRGPGPLARRACCKPTATDPGHRAAPARGARQPARAFTGEILNRGKDGRVYWLSLEIQPLRADDGALLGFMAVELDITERKAAEQRTGAASGCGCPTSSKAPAPAAGSGTTPAARSSSTRDGR